MEINKVHHLDFLKNTLPDKCAKLIVADPPYFEVKGDFDFIWPSFEDYLKDVEKWAIECKRLLSDNGTLFWWGHAKKIAYSQIILDKYFNLESVIKWHKIDCQTRKNIAGYRQFAPVTEHLLMYSQDEFNLTECVYFIRDYIRQEIIKSKGKIVFKEINQALGTATNGGGVASACLSLDKKEPGMITKEMYQKLQAYCNDGHLTKEYEHLREEYEQKRRYFNNYARLTDVWDFAQQSHISAKYDHDTQKTEQLARIIIGSTTKKGDLVVIPFAGSGTECAMAALERRDFIGFDIEQKHVNTSNNRVLNILNKPTLNL